MVGLSQTQTRAVGEFSKGMQRRIGLAQALINDPDLVILDEPTSGLDPIGCREVKDLILALARRGKTVILSSHLLSDVEDVCDRVVIYYGGKIQAMGTLKELLAKPDTIAHHHAGAAARNPGARAGNHPQGRRRGQGARWTIRRRTWKAIFSTWCKKRAGPRRKLRRAVRRARGRVSARRREAKTARPTKFWNDWLCRRLPSRFPAKTAGAGCHRAEGGRQKTGSPDQSRRTPSAGTEPQRKPRSAKADETRSSRTKRFRRSDVESRRNPRRSCVRNELACGFGILSDFELRVRFARAIDCFDFMQRLFAIAWLTWKAAFRFRLFLVIAVLLLVSVVGLPLLIKDDGTARGFTQILLTYTLSAITALLGLSTLWLACGTLARDIEECQIQVVADQAHRALANLAGQMAGHHVAERRAAGIVRRQCLRLAAMARGETAGGGAERFARTGAGGARLGQGTQQRGGH